MRVNNLVGKTRMKAQCSWYIQWSSVRCSRTVVDKKNLIPSLSMWVLFFLDEAGSHVHGEEMGSTGSRNFVNPDTTEQPTSVSEYFLAAEKGNSKCREWLKENYPYLPYENYFVHDYISDVHGKVFSSRVVALNYIVPRLMRVARRVYGVEDAFLVKENADKRMSNIHRWSLIRQEQLTYAYNDEDWEQREPIFGLLSSPVFGIVTDGVSVICRQRADVEFLSRLKNGELPVPIHSLHMIGDVVYVSLSVVYDNYRSWGGCMDETSFCMTAINHHDSPFLGIANGSILLEETSEDKLHTGECRTSRMLLAIRDDVHSLAVDTETGITSLGELMVDPNEL